MQCDRVFCSVDDMNNSNELGIQPERNLNVNVKGLWNKEMILDSSNLFYIERAGCPFVELILAVSFKFMCC